MYRRIHPDQHHPASSRPTSSREIDRSRGVKRRHLAHYSGLDDASIRDAGDYDTLEYVSRTCSIRRPTSSGRFNSVHSVAVPDHLPFAIADCHFLMSLDPTVRRRPRVFEHEFLEGPANQGGTFESGVALRSHRRPVNHKDYFDLGVALRSDHRKALQDCPTHQDYFESVACSDNPRRAHHVDLFDSLALRSHHRSANQNMFQSIVTRSHLGKANHDSYQSVAPCNDRHLEIY